MINIIFFFLISWKPVSHPLFSIGALIQRFFSKLFLSMTIADVLKHKQLDDNPWTYSVPFCSVANDS